METEVLTQKYLIDGDEENEFTLDQIMKSNEFKVDDELFCIIADMHVGETIGNGLNMAIITRIK